MFLRKYDRGKLSLWEMWQIIGVERNDDIKDCFRVLVSIKVNEIHVCAALHVLLFRVEQ